MLHRRVVARIKFVVFHGIAHGAFLVRVHRTSPDTILAAGDLGGANGAVAHVRAARHFTGVLLLLIPHPFTRGASGNERKRGNETKDMFCAHSFVLRLEKR